MAMHTVSTTMVIVLAGIFGLMLMITIASFTADKKIPAIKEIRKAYKKNKQLGVFHHPQGYATFKCIDSIESSNQLDLDDKYGVVFAPNDPKQAEFIDGKVASFHYIVGYPYTVNVQGISAISRCMNIVRKHMIEPTGEKLSTIMHRDMSKSNDDLRKDMVPGSVERIPDKELNKMRKATDEMKTTYKRPGPFAFAEAKDFMLSVGMSAAVSLREWKSYIIAVERGNLPRTSRSSIDAKAIVSIIMALAIGYAIVKSVSLNTLTSGIGFP